MTEHRFPLISEPITRAEHPPIARSGKPHLSTYTPTPNTEKSPFAWCTSNHTLPPPDAAHACSVARETPSNRTIASPLIEWELDPARRAGAVARPPSTTPNAVRRSLPVRYHGWERGGQPRWSDADPVEMPNGYRTAACDLVTFVAAKGMRGRLAAIVEV